MRKIFVLPLLFAIPAALPAQSNYAALPGSVTDPQQRAIPQAHVRISSTVTGAASEVLSDGAGLYDAEGLPPGPYRVEVDSPASTSALSAQAYLNLSELERP